MLDRARESNDQGGLAFRISSHDGRVRAAWRRTLRVYDVGRVEDLLLGDREGADGKKGAKARVLGGVEGLTEEMSTGERGSHCVAGSVCVNADRW